MIPRYFKKVNSHLQSKEEELDSYLQELATLSRGAFVVIPTVEQTNFQKNKQIEMKVPHSIQGQTKVHEQTDLTKKKTKYLIRNKLQD